jgi:hypothetical protein
MQLCTAVVWARGQSLTLAPVLSGPTESVAVAQQCGHAPVVQLLPITLQQCGHAPVVR